METFSLTSPEYWESASVDLRLNPALSVDTKDLVEFLSSEEQLESVVVIPTSGSSGTPKFVMLKKQALLDSASAVNHFCGVTPDDIWFGGLSTFHVGGLGIYARGFLSGSKIVEPRSLSWNRGSMFCEELCENRVTLTSLTPSHLHDLLQREEVAPESLRGVFLGGGSISGALVERAIELGWPIWPTYGMSEASSQVATNLNGDPEWLPVLPHWKSRVDEMSGRLEIQGDALFSGYVRRVDGAWNFDDPRSEDGWFRTEDRVELRDGKLRFLSRADDMVKVLGELVSISGIERKLASAGVSAVVFRRPDPRRENVFSAVVEGVEISLDDVNRCLNPLEHLEKVVLISEFPRTEIGKIDRSELRRFVT